MTLEGEITQPQAEKAAAAGHRRRRMAARLLRQAGPRQRELPREPARALARLVARPRLRGRASGSRILPRWRCASAR